MCHLLLLLPLVMLPVFWLMPASLAIPVYAVAVVVAGWLYVYALKAMRLPLVNEDEQLKRAVGEVVAVQPRGLCRVALFGESWQAKSRDALHEGDVVRVVGRDGLVLRVEKAELPD